MFPDKPIDGEHHVCRITGSTGRYLDEPLTPREVGDAVLKQAMEQSEAEIQVLTTRAAIMDRSMALLWMCTSAGRAKPLIGSREEGPLRDSRLLWLSSLDGMLGTGGRSP
jgi:hypothetical protein